MNAAFIGLLIGVPLIFLLRRQLKRLQTADGHGHWALLCLGAAAGGIVGVIINRYQFPVGSHLRIQGCPVPGVLFQLKDGQWTDFVFPLAVLNYGMSIALLCLAGADSVAVVLGRKKNAQNKVPHTIVGETPAQREH